MTANTASATSLASKSSDPYCFEARVVRKARISESAVNGVSSVLQASSVNREMLISHLSG
jgi:hypothetical protein